MKTMLMTGSVLRVLGLTSLLFVTACSGEDPNSGSTQDAVTGRQGECAADEEEANDKIYCSADADCDADEFCLNGRCTGYDGDVEDDDCEADEDDEEGEDKITCSVTADCDPDEVCTNGLCTGLDGEEEDDEEEPGDKITCSVDADCDADEVCTDGLCT
jgi:hypothetical protein